MKVYQNKQLFKRMMQEKLTVKDLAFKCNLSKPTINHALNNKHLKLKTMYIIAETLKCETSILFTDILKNQKIL